MKTEDIELFHKVAETGSLTKTAEILGLPKSNVSRRIKDLEQQLRVALFLRQNRSLSLTTTGQQFYNDTRPLISQLQQAVDKVMKAGAELEGHLRVHTLTLPTVEKLQKQVFDFMRRHPKVTIELMITPNHENIIEQHIDVAFRAGRELKDSSVVARLYEEVNLGYYASPRYLEQYGSPKTFADLSNHRIIGFRSPEGDLQTELPTTVNHPAIKVKPSITVNNMALMYSIAKSGEAIGILTDATAKQDVDEGLLVRLFPDQPGFKAFIWTVYSSRQQLNAVTRAFIDFLYEEQGLHEADATAK